MKTIHPETIELPKCDDLNLILPLLAEQNMDMSNEIATMKSILSKLEKKHINQNQRLKKW